ncbi:MAG: hypothetical protein MI717_12990 [Spirochaetales bacterium]|nr:hypothetical protein [Spirochaetales bacterium]
MTPLVMGQSATLTPGLWDTSTYRDIPLDSNNVQELVEGALLAFDRVNQGHSTSPSEDVALSRERIEKAYRLSHRRDGEITTLYATIHLWAAGQAKKLRDKIRFTTQGINAFENALALSPDNFEVLALQLVSCVSVPTYFQNLTTTLIHSGERFMAWDQHALSPEEKRIWEDYHPRVALVLAEAKSRQKDGEAVRFYLNQIPEGSLERAGWENLQDRQIQLERKWQ